VSRKSRKFKGLGAGKGIGMKKHAKSGNNQISPKLRHKMKREAEANEQKASEPLPYTSIAEALADRKR